MLWNRLFSPVETIEAAGLKQYVAQHQEGTYNLIDVRQPSEYEKEHIPGARLIPLPELASHLEALDKAKPTIVY